MRKPLKPASKGFSVGRYRIEGEDIVNTWEELDDYIARSLEFIRSIFSYSERELLSKDEIDFFKTLNRAQAKQKKEIAANK